MAQTGQNVTITPDLLWSMAHTLKQELQDGSIMRADLRAIELRSALHGTLPEKMYAGINSSESLPDLDKPQPQLTAALVALADQLLQSLEEHNLDAARTCSEQLAARVHAQYSLYLRKQNESAPNTGDADLDRYFTISQQLRDSLTSGDIQRAASLAVELQTAENVLLAKRKFVPKSSIGRTTYDINDALGRAAFLRKNYPAACDLLLKAADTKGDPALRSFGPDLWLARALLQAGYKDFVLTFLQRCKVFWDPPRLDDWISLLQSGGTPDFGMNIFSKNPATSQ
jgi:hypothetical protein